MLTRNVLLASVDPPGAKQNGTKLGDCILPPWAKGDPREFIRVHRDVRIQPAWGHLGSDSWQHINL